MRKAQLLGLGLCLSSLAPTPAESAPKSSQPLCQQDVTPPVIPPGCPPAPSTLDTWPSAEELGEFNRWMAGLGPRLTASGAHECLLAEIERALDPVVTPDGPLEKIDCLTKFTNWRAETWGLALDGGESFEAAGYMPFSGLTPPDGVTAELVFEEPGYWKRAIPLLNLLGPSKFKKKKHEGKIVAVSIPTVKFPKWLLKFVSRNRRSDFGGWAPYRRTIALERQLPCLDQAKEAGVQGVIAVLDMSAAHAGKQYLPFSRKVPQTVGEGVPGIHVDWRWKGRLKDHVTRPDGQRNVTVTLTGAVTENDSSRHLIYELPGARAEQSDDEVILLQTHTDGPSAAEENGVMALIALVHHFAGMPQDQRRRTLVFLFATGHFVKAIEGAKDLIWEAPPEWLARTKAAVAIEHLGTKEWIDSCEDGYRPRVDPGGEPRDEPALVFVTGGKHPLERLAADHLPAARRMVIPARWRLGWTLGRRFFGEGQYVACTGVPTVGYVPNPDYMFSFADPGAPTRRGHFEKLDPQRMLDELEAFRDLTQELMIEPLADWPDVMPDPKRCKEPEDPCE